MIDIKAIKAAAEAATQGNWWVTAQGKHVVAANEGRVCVAPEHMAQWNWDANATHIATANPATVIALLDRLEAAEKDAARYRWLAWKSDTNQIMPYDSKNDRFYFGYECDAAIDAAMKEQK